MTTKMSRVGLIALVVVALIALAAYAAACGDSGATTTTASTSTPSSTAGSTNETTITQGGKSLDDYRAAVPGLEKTVQQNPSDRDSLQDLAIAYYQLGEYEQAAATYQKMLALSNDAFTHNNLGNVYRDWKKYDQAIGEYETAISIDPTLKQPYINLAGVYKTQGDLEKAVQVLDQAAKSLNAEDKAVVEKYEQQITSTTTTT